MKQEQKGKTKQQREKDDDEKLAYDSPFMSEKARDLSLTELTSWKKKDKPNVIKV